MSMSDGFMKNRWSIWSAVAICIFIFFVYQASANAASSMRGPLAKSGLNNCSHHNPLDSSVPICPSSGSILPPWYPAAAVTIAESFSLPTQSVEEMFGIDRKKMLADTIEKFWRAQPGKPPQIFLNGRSETREWLIRELNRRGLANQEVVAKGITLNPDMVQGQSWTWQQDMFQESFDAATGRPIMREITPYFSRGTRRVIRTTIARMQQQCGVVQAPSIHYNSPVQSGMMGGNIEGFPGGICVVGSSDLDEKARREYFPLACGAESKVVEIDTSYLSPGHVDEFFTVVPDRKKEGDCAFAVLYASPMKAFDLLQSEPHAAAIQMPSLTKVEAENRIAMNSEWLRICSLFHQLPKVNIPGRDKPANDRPGKARTVSLQSSDSSLREPTSETDKRVERREKLVGELRRRLKLALDRDEKFESELPKNYFRRDCSNLTNRDLLKTLDTPEGLRYPAIDFNMSVQISQESNVETIREALKKQLPHCTPEFIPVPQLFWGKTLPVAGRAMSIYQTGSSITPPSTNGVLIGNRYLMPDPMNQSMRDHNAKLFKRLGIELDFVDTYSLHRAYGNLHCATNVARYCRPRGSN
jgi:hypothetical protein